MSKRIVIPTSLPDDVRKLAKKILEDARGKIDLNTINVHLIIEFALNAHYAQEAKNELLKNGVVNVDRVHGGMTKKNPAFQVYRDSVRTMLDIRKDLKFSDQMADPLEDDPMMNIIKEKK